MTKSMSTGCIKENETASLLDYNILSETVDLDDPSGHLFIVHVFFYEKNTT